MRPHAVHAVAEQAAKAGLCGCFDVRIAIRAEAVHEAEPRVSRATLVVPARMDHRDCMRACRCLDLLRCRPLDDVGRAVGRELVLCVQRATAGRRFGYGNDGRLPPGGFRRGAADPREEERRHRAPAMRHFQRTACSRLLCVLPPAGLEPCHSSSKPPRRRDDGLASPTWHAESDIPRTRRRR
jgi:hypothetical protein